MSCVFGRREGEEGGEDVNAREEEGKEEAEVRENADGRAGRPASSTWAGIEPSSSRSDRECGKPSSGFLFARADADLGDRGDRGLSRRARAGGSGRPDLRAGVRAWARGASWIAIDPGRSGTREGCARAGRDRASALRSWRGEKNGTHVIEHGAVLVHRRGHRRGASVGVLEVQEARPAVHRLEDVGAAFRGGDHGGGLPGHLAVRLNIDVRPGVHELENFFDVPIQARLLERGEPRERVVVVDAHDASEARAERRRRGAGREREVRRGESVRAVVNDSCARKARVCSKSRATTMTRSRSDESSIVSLSDGRLLLLPLIALSSRPRSPLLTASAPPRAPPASTRPPYPPPPRTSRSRTDRPRSPPRPDPPPTEPAAEPPRSSRASPRRSPRSPPSRNPPPSSDARRRARAKTQSPCTRGYYQPRTPNEEEDEASPSPRSRLRSPAWERSRCRPSPGRRRRRPYCE